MISDSLDPSLLRAYVSVCRHGSLSRAAEQAGRAQSALSLQMSRLEGLLGKRLLRRTRRGVVPTPEGEIFLGYATRILSLSEEAVASVGERSPSGPIRIGLAEEIAITALPAALGQLRRAWPDLLLDVVVDHSMAIAERWKEGELDVAIATCSAFTGDAAATWDIELLWVSAIDHEPVPGQPLEVIVYSDPCLWRRRMLDALAEGGHDYQVTMTSQSIAAIRAGVANGLGTALMTAECIQPETMRILAPCAQIPPPLLVQYGLYARDRPDAAMKAAIDLLTRCVRDSVFAARQ